MPLKGNLRVGQICTANLDSQKISAAAKFRKQLTAATTVKLLDAKQLWGDCNMIVSCMGYPAPLLSCNSVLPLVRVISTLKAEIEDIDGN